MQAVWCRLVSEVRLSFTFSQTIICHKDLGETTVSNRKQSQKGQALFCSVKMQRCFIVAYYSKWNRAFSLFVILSYTFGIHLVFGKGGCCLGVPCKKRREQCMQPFHFPFFCSSPQSVLMSFCSVLSHYCETTTMICSVMVSPIGSLRQRHCRMGYQGWASRDVSMLPERHLTSRAAAPCLFELVINIERAESRTPKFVRRTRRLSLALSADSDASMRVNPTCKDWFEVEASWSNASWARTAKWRQRKQEIHTANRAGKASKVDHVVDHMQPHGRIWRNSLTFFFAAGRKGLDDVVCRRKLGKMRTLLRLYLRWFNNYLCGKHPPDNRSDAFS